MLGKYVAAYVVIIETLDTIIGSLDGMSIQNAQAPDTDTSRLALALMGKEPPLPDDTAKRVSNVLDSILKHMTSRMTFPSVIAQANRITEAIEKKEGPKALSAKITELRTRLKDELNERWFLYVSPERVEFYRNSMLMGKEVNDCFPKAIDDIEDAGKCLALGQGTACVLHTMRVMECGLKAVSESLELPHSPSWDAVLKKISGLIDQDHRKKTLKWKKAEPFYRDISGDLLTVKQAWRNPAMHVDRRYSPDEAEQIFTAAKNFMQKLAAHLGEKRIAKLAKQAASRSS